MSFFENEKLKGGHIGPPLQGLAMKSKCSWCSYTIFFICLFIVSIAGGWGACGGDAAGTSDSDSGTTVSSDDLKSLQSIPDLNLDEYDLATNTTTSASISQALAKALNQADESGEKVFSRAGCEMRSCVEEFKRQIKQFQSELCILKKMEENTDLEVGDGAFNYYEMTFTEEFLDDFFEEEEGDLSVSPALKKTQIVEVTDRVRVGIIEDVLKVDVCSSEGGDMEQIISIQIAVDDGKFSGDLVDKFTNPFDTTEKESMQFSIDLAVEDPALFQEGDEASLIGKFDSPQWGGGRIDLSLKKKSGLLTNEVDAAFKSGDEEAEWGTWEALVYGIFDKNEGCSKWKATGTYPAEQIGNAFRDDFSLQEVQAAGYGTSDYFCWKEADDPDSPDNTLADWIDSANSNNQCTFSEGGDSGTTECFFYELVNSTVNSYVLDTGSASHFDDVDARTLLSYERPTIVFINEWDCEAESGASFTDLDPSEVGSVFEECFEFEDQADQDRDIESCYEQERSEDAMDDYFGDFECAGDVELTPEDTLNDSTTTDICTCLDFNTEKCKSVGVTCSEGGADTVGKCLELVVGFGVQGDGGDYICGDLKYSSQYTATNLTTMCTCFGYTTEECNNIAKTCDAVDAHDMDQCLDASWGYYNEEDFGDESCNALGDFETTTLDDSGDFTNFCTCFAFEGADCDAVVADCSGRTVNGCLDKLFGFEE